MHQGYIKLFRKFQKWEWYTDSLTLHLFLHLVLSANHEDKKWHGIDIKRGQFLSGLNSLHTQTGISIQSIRTSLRHLESTGEITLKSTNKFTVVSITNYDTYQDRESESNKQLTNNQQTTNKQLTTTNNDKNVNNDKNDKKNSLREKKKFLPPSLEDIKGYIIENSFSVNADAFYKYFTEGNWIDSKGNKVLNWKQKLITWEGGKNNGQHGRSTTGNKQLLECEKGKEGKYDNIPKTIINTDD